MKKPIYITKRVYKDRSIPQVVFNNPVTGKRVSVISVPSLYKKVYSNDFRKLNKIPDENFWTDNHIMDLVLKAVEKGLIDLDENITGSISFVDYATTIWTFDSSPRVARLNREKEDSIHKSHADDVLGALKKHVFPILPFDLKLKDFSFVNAENIKDIMLEKECSNSTINKVMSGIRVVLEEAYRKGIIKDDRASRIKNVRSNSKHFGILSNNEVGRLLNFLDEQYAPKTFDRYKYLTIALALQSCARQGEIVALRPSRLIKHDTYYSVEISKSWNEKEGEKTPKNGKKRFTAISIELGDELLEYSELNPNNKFDGYIFFSKDNPLKPLDKEDVRESFYEALQQALGIDEESRKKRKITFHSNRHTAIVELDQVSDKREIKLATGHSSDSVFNTYANHQTEEDISKLADGVNRISYVSRHKNKSEVGCYNDKDRISF